jgi:hypothetical protein
LARVASVASILLLRDRLIFVAIAVTLFGYVLSAAFVDFEQSRLNLAIVPFVFYLAAGPFAPVLHVIETGAPSMAAASRCLITAGEWLRRKSRAWVR